MRVVRKPSYRVKQEDDTWFDDPSSDEDMAPKPRKSALKREFDDDGLENTFDEYHEKRLRNNMAVRKSRAKMRSMREDAVDSMNEMSQQRTELESMMGNLSDEIKMLKDVLIGITGGSAPSTPSSPDFDIIDLSKLKYFDFSK